MKPENLLKTYFHKRLENIGALMEKPQNQFSPEDFHKLRVEIKKQKALFKMVAYCTKHFKSQLLFKPLKQLFLQAGKVRDLQLEAEMIKKQDRSNRLKNYVHLIELQIKEEKKTFFQFENKVKGKLKKINLQIIPFFIAIDKKGLEKYIKEELKQVTLLLKRKTLKTKKLHQLRKKLKSFHYNLKCLDIKQEETLCKNRTQLQDMMGKWHDYNVMTSHLLKMTRSKKFTPTEIQALRAIAAKLSQNSLALFQMINTMKNIHII